MTSNYLLEVDRQILEGVANPNSPGENLETNTGFLHVYYQKNINEELEFDGIPSSWQQLCTCKEGLTMWETQFMGNLPDRSLVESLIVSTLVRYQNENVIGEYRIRYNYPPYETQDYQDSNDEDDFELFLSRLRARPPCEFNSDS